MKIAKGKIILFTFFLFSTNYLFSQSMTFKKVYPGFSIDPYDFSIACKGYNNDKSFLIYTSGMQLIKINKIGEIISKKNYLNHGYFIHPYFGDNGTITFYSDYGNNKKLLKLDTSLNFISEIQYDSISWWLKIDRSIICPAFNNGFLLSGGRGTLTPLIVKTDSSGYIIWSKYFTPIQGGIQVIIQTQDSGFAIAVNLENAAASLIKTDKNGDVLWAKSYFRPRGFVHSLVENDDETIMMTGSTDSINTWPDYGLYTSPLFVTKLDKNGNVIWAKTFEIADGIRTWPSQIKRTQDNGFIILATTTIPTQNDDLLLIKLDSNGDTLWVRAHGSPQSFDCGHSIEQLNDKGYIICGGSNNNIPVPVSSLYLIRTDSLGHTDSLCEEYSLPLAINNITVNDSNITVTSVPFTVNTNIPDTSTQNFTTYAYDGCHLDDIPELYAEQTTPLLIYPNPNDGKFQISSSKSQASSIEVYNINSERVYSGTTNESLTDIDLTGYARGLYFVRMSNERWVKTGKVMVY
ncbi:MAG: T9SS type A sorting domain-containing protein [Bacteroidota bacterium]